MYALIDCNNFYASCQRVFNPALNHQPVVVLSNNDGCVIARSNEAKSIGIPMGAPAFKWEPFFKQHGVHVFSCNFALYGDMSRRVMNLLATFSPDIEVYSIDEAFLEFTGNQNTDFLFLGSQIRTMITRGTGIPISVGFAPTKVLAKVANKIAKKFPDRTGDVYVIDTENKREKALRWTKIEDVWGIGRRETKKLQKIGVFNAHQFTQLNDAWVKTNMSITGLRIKKELEGISVLELEEVEDKRSIATTRSFDTMLTTEAELEERITTYATLSAEKLRRQQGVCQLITVFIKTNRFKPELPQYYRSVTVAIDFPTSSTIDIIKAAKKGLKEIFLPEFHYKKAGVILSEIQETDAVQLNLFHIRNAKHEVLMKTIDDVNKYWGGDRKVRFAGQSLNYVWKMRQEKLSPRYTTRIHEVIEINLKSEK